MVCGEESCSEPTREFVNLNGGSVSGAIMSFGVDGQLVAGRTYRAAELSTLQVTAGFADRVSYATMAGATGSITIDSVTRGLRSVCPENMVVHGSGHIDDLVQLKVDGAPPAHVSLDVTF